LILNNHPKLKDYLFYRGRLRDEPSKLILCSKSFSSGEQVLVKIALDFWDNSANALLRDVYQALDFDNFRNVLKAINLKRAGIE
ncbi:MAG: hypothetical protein KJN80_01365, partial [Deltaproteobacteria bacterium]|nr:hypothetical protein [Deltaproteobacteria bacterium]